MLIKLFIHVFVVDILPFIFSMTSTNAIPAYSMTSLSYTGSWYPGGCCRQLKIENMGPATGAGQYLVVQRINGSQGFLGLNEVEAYPACTPMQFGNGNDGFVFYCKIIFVRWL